MKFGKVENPEEIDFTIPPDDKATKSVFAKETAKELEVWVGCAKWNSKDLKGFYPKGVKAKDELLSAKALKIKRQLKAKLAEQVAA